MSFEVRKQHKLQDQIEQLAYEWAIEDVCEYYNVEEPSELNQEQIDEIFAYSESDDCYEGYVGMALRSICDQWEYDQDD
jgi:hypothetical protein